MRCGRLSGWIGKVTHISLHCLHMQTFVFVFASRPGRRQVWVMNHSNLLSRKDEKQRWYFHIFTLLFQSRNFQTENTHLRVCKNKCWSISKAWWWLSLNWVEIVFFHEALDRYLFIRKSIQSEFENPVSLLFLAVVTVGE